MHRDREDLRTAERQRGLRTPHPHGASRPADTHCPGTPEAADAADNLACILFTAGTGGPPKGVCLAQRAT